MFSIKQFLINASSEIRQEIKKLIDEIEASIPTEVSAIEEAAVPAETKAETAEAEAKTPTAE